MTHSLLKAADVHLISIKSFISRTYTDSTTSSPRESALVKQFDFRGFPHEELHQVQGQFHKLSLRAIFV